MTSSSTAPRSPTLPGSPASWERARAYNCLKRAGITQVGEILEKLKKGHDEILAIRNFGQKSLDELIERLEEKGYMNMVNEDGGEIPQAMLSEYAD